MGINGGMNLIKIESQESSIGVAYFFLEYLKNFCSISNDEVENFLSSKSDCTISTVQLYNEVMLKFYPGFYLIQQQFPVGMLELTEKEQRVYCSDKFSMNIQAIKSLTIKGLATRFRKKRKFIRFPRSFVEEVYKGDCMSEERRKEERWKVDIEAWGEIMLHPYKIGKIKKRRNYWLVEITTKSLK